MSHNHSHSHNENCECKPSAAVQSLDEMDFERGIWSAGMLFQRDEILTQYSFNFHLHFLKTALYNDVDKLRKFIGSGHTNDVDATGTTTDSNRFNLHE